MHVSVLLKESIDGLEIKEGETFLDATLGNGGHSSEVAKQFSNKVKIVGIDADEDAIKRSKENIEKSGNTPILILGNYGNTKEVLAKEGITNIDKALIDAGFSSDQLESGRGFSFLKDEPLLMTLSKDVNEETLTAREVVNNWEEENIQTIISLYGEERYAGKIARAIVRAREVKPIETSGELAEIIKNSVPPFYRRGRIHPATRTFQAIRIVVNSELQSIEKGIRDIFEILNKDGRFAFIAFHSLEDRLVKRFFKEKEKEGLAKLITKKPIRPTAEEVEQNPRSRSAKLRIIQKI